MIATREFRCAMATAFALAASGAALEAGAAYACSITVTSIATVYDPTIATNNDSTGTYTISCTRLASDPASVNYTLRANNGLHAGGGSRRVQNGPPANRYNYGLYRDAAYTQTWGSTNWSDINGTLNFGVSLFATVTAPFYMRVPTLQPVDPAGTYTDSVGVRLDLVVPGPNPQFNGSLGITVITTPSCQISAAPGPATFNYVSFQPAPAVASTTYGVRCTTALPYTMALDATSVTDNSVNLAYALALSAPSGTGTGVTQTYSVNGTMAAGQAGTCAVGACTNAAATNKTRTLTLTW